MDFIKILSEQKEELKSLNLKNLIKRKEESQLSLDSKFAQVVIGVRRCGKSVLCQKVLLESGLNFGYINFDDERLIGVRPEELDDILAALYRINGEFNHLFIDEVQNIDKWQLFVNRLLRQGMKVILTGSNANLLSVDLATHLTGRYNQIELFPFSFSEYCEVKKIEKFNITTKAEALRKRALQEYLFEGGFPEVVEGVAPRHFAQRLLTTIVKKDVGRRYKIRYEEVLWNLCNLLLENIGGIISPSILAPKLGIKSFHTVERYLKFLHNAYILIPVKKYSFKALERRLNYKSYAIDMAFVSDHDDQFQGENLGWRLENVVAIELKRRIALNLLEELYFASNGREYDVDFIITERRKIKSLIQVCYDFRDPSVKLRNREIGNLIKAAKSTGCSDLTLIIFEGKTGEIKIDNFTVKIVSATEWLLEGVEF